MEVRGARLGVIRQRLAEAGADAAVLSFLPDVRWAVGFSGSNGLLVVRPDAAHFVTDGRYDTQARQEVESAEVHVPGYDLAKYVREAGLLGGAARVLVQGDHVTLSTLEYWADLFESVAFVPVKEWLVDAVAAKEAWEVERIRRAQSITDEVFTALLPLVTPGVREQELAAEIVYQHLQRGCERMAFEPIVAAGPRSSLPHAHPTGEAFRSGDVIVIDMGGVVDGYASDMTRTLALGEPEAEAKRVYQVVLDAQHAALDVVAAGRTGKEVDAAARTVIHAAGYGEFFSHGLGHGVGIQTHEWPRLSYHVEHVLPENAAVTIEPGVYLPERFGVRIEDLVIVQAGGHENLTASSKALLVL